MNVSVNSLKTIRRKNLADLISPDPNQQDWKSQTLLNELRIFTITEHTEHILNTLTAERTQDAYTINSDKSCITKEK